MNVWRMSPGLVVIILVVLAVLSGQLPGQGSVGAEDTADQELRHKAQINDQIAIMMRDGKCGSKRKFGHIMPCGRGE